MFFSFPPYPEDFGNELPETIVLSGKIFDIEGNPVSTSVHVSLNTQAAQYQTQYTYVGFLQIPTDSVTGRWFTELPDTTQMRADIYYRFTINGRVFRKSLPDFPLEAAFNDLQDYG